ncbi:MAG: TonB family protein [Pseudomonadota bacterium]
MAVERFKTQVLILHPHEAVLNACRTVFGDEEYTLHLATSGREALAMLGETPIDYFVTAEELPGMTGSEALKEARRRSPETRGILIAARDTSADEIASLANSQDFEAVLRSSASPRELYNLVADAAKRRRLGDLGESANDADHVVDTSASAINLPSLAENGDEKPLFVVDDDADITGGSAALGTNVGTAEATPRAGTVEILVLTNDEAFFHAIGQAARGLHSTQRCPTLQEAADIIGLGRVGVLVTDAAVAPSEVQSITARLRQIQPGLVTIVAGRRDDGDQLMGLITEGIVYRFLLKPVSPGRARLAIEASVKKAIEYRDNPPPPPQAPPARLSGTSTIAAARSSIIENLLGDDDEGGGFGRYLIVGIALTLVLAVGGYFLFGDGGDTVEAAAETVVTDTPASEPATDDIPSPPPEAAPVATEQPAAPAPGPAVEPAPQPTDEVFELRRAAFRALAEGRVAAPDDDNALSLYATAMRLDPYAEGLREEFDTAVAEALSVTESAITRGALNEAAATLARIREVQPYQARLPFLESQLRKERIRRLIAQARDSAANGDTETALGILDRATSLSTVEDPSIAAARDEILAGDDSRELQQLLTLASQRMTEGALTSPARDNAAFYYRAVLARDAGNAIARQGLELIGASMLTDANRALQAGQLDRAGSLADAALTNGAPRSGVDQLRGQIAAERERLEQIAESEAAAERARVAAEEAAARLPTEEFETPLARDAEPSASNDAIPVPAGSTPVSVPQPAQLPDLIRTKYVAPTFPRGAARRNLSGWAHLEFTITPDGKVTDVVVRDSQPGTTFVSAARRALQQWEYEPTIVDGIAVERKADVRINFSLTN